MGRLGYDEPKTKSRNLHSALLYGYQVVFRQYLSARFQEKKKYKAGCLKQ